MSSIGLEKVLQIVVDAREAARSDPDVLVVEAYRKVLGQVEDVARSHLAAPDVLGGVKRLVERTLEMSDSTGDSALEVSADRGHLRTALDEILWKLDPEADADMPGVEEADLRIVLDTVRQILDGTRREWTRGLVSREPPAGVYDALKILEGIPPKPPVVVRKAERVLDSCGAGRIYDSCSGSVQMEAHGIVADTVRSSVKALREALKRHEEGGSLTATLIAVEDVALLLQKILPWTSSHSAAAPVSSVRALLKGTLRAGLDVTDEGVRRKDLIEEVKYLRTIVVKALKELERVPVSPPGSEELTSGVMEVDVTLESNRTLTPAESEEVMTHLVETGYAEDTGMLNEKGEKAYKIKPGAEVEAERYIEQEAYEGTATELNQCTRALRMILEKGLQDRLEKFSDMGLDERAGVLEDTALSAEQLVSAAQHIRSLHYFLRFAPPPRRGLEAYELDLLEQIEDRLMKTPPAEFGLDQAHADVIHKLLGIFKEVRQ